MQHLILFKQKTFQKNYNEGEIVLDSKVVRHHANIKNPSRCFVQQYKTYISHLPSQRKCDAFYLTPLKKPNGNVWYTKTPVGHNTLGRTVSCLCKTSGIQGLKPTIPCVLLQLLDCFILVWMSN